MRAVIFARFKMVQVKTELKENYFLIFYKNSLIFGGKLENVEEGTFIDKAFKEGIVLETNHPFLPFLIPGKIFSLPAKNKLFTHLQREYALQEVACIAASLDSFFSKEYLIKIIEKVFFHFRRNGNFFKAFQVIQILADFSPSLKSARDILHSREFDPYFSFYNSSSISSIHEKDPLFAEFYCYKNREIPDHYKMLKNTLRNQERLAELLLLWLEKPKNLTDSESIKNYTELALLFMPMETWILTLCYVKINPFREMPESLNFIERLVLDGCYEKAAIYLFNFIDDLPYTYNDILNDLWKHLDASFVASHLDKFLPLLQQSGQEDEHEKSEQRLLQLTVKLLEEHDVMAVHKKLLPIQKNFTHSNVIRKINKMAEILEDPDRMMELGQYYAEFNQYDKAIECFFWEMELNPRDPSPVWQLCKMYQHKGLVQEASAYQQIYTQLRSNQKTG